MDLSRGLGDVYKRQALGKSSQKPNFGSLRENNLIFAHFSKWKANPEA
jgi:hypothetical protein